MIAFDRYTLEADVAAAIDEVRRTVERRDELVALLAERAPLYDGRTTAEVTRLRGWLLAAFADTGLPAAALPYALEALESGHMPYEVAGAAIAVRGIDAPGMWVVPYLMRALRNLSGADATMSFECYDPRWPFEEPTTALAEVLHTLAGLGAQAAGALPELERLDASADYPAAARAQMRATIDAIVAARNGCGGAERLHGCCEERASVEPLVVVGAVRPSLPDVTLEDQDGLMVGFAEYFCGQPSVVAFFYTRCENPYKCSLTVSKLAELQARTRERGVCSALRLAAITYDSDFDHPGRLKVYAEDRGLQFGDRVRCFRVRSGFEALSHFFAPGVNYGPSTVNRHRIEVYVLGADGALAAAFARLQWDPEEVLAAALALLGPGETPWNCNGPQQRNETQTAAS